MQTELMINHGGFPPFSARGCQQTLQPIDTGELRRTVNGELIYTGKIGYHKYQSTIECQDETAPSLEGIWRGAAVDVQCIQRLWQQVTVNDSITQLNVTLERAAVAGSITVLLNGAVIAAHSTAANQVMIEHPLQSGDQLFINYRPQLKMRVTHFNLVTNEWRQSCGWRLLLEEI